jgi:DNA-binding CsgD family transcriptional regulator
MTQQYLFSEREKKVIELLLQGKSNKQIALTLGVSQSTVEYHLKNIYKKLQVNSRTEAVLQLGKSIGDNASGELGKSTVEVDGEPVDNGEKPISTRRISMKNLFYIIGGLLVAILIAVPIIADIPVKNTSLMPTVQAANTPLQLAPNAVLSPTPATSSKEHILEQIRQLAIKYDQAVQAEKQNGKVEFSKDSNTGEDIFLFKEESYFRIGELFSQFLSEKTQLEQFYIQLYRDETLPTPFPIQSSPEQDEAYYKYMMEQSDSICSLESWEQYTHTDKVMAYDPDMGKYRAIFMGDVIARCEIYGRMLEEFRVAPLLAKVNKEADMAMIRQVTGKPDLRSGFQSIQGIANAPGRSAALYVDETGTNYYVDIETSRLAQIEPHFPTHPNIPADKIKSIDELRSIAEQFALANSPRLADFKSTLEYEENGKGDIYFFCWDYRNKDWSGTDWAMMPPFLQIGVLANGDVIIYINTLDLFN